MTLFVEEVVPGKMAGMKLYVVTRRDLSPGAQAVQSCHALWQFSFQYPDIGRTWFVESNTLSLLSVADEMELADLLEKAEDAKIRHAAFREPDLSNAFTAIALEPGSRTKKLVAKLPLTLRSRQK